MENIENLIKSAIAPVLSKLSAIQAENAQLRHDLNTIKQTVLARSKYLSYSPKHSSSHHDAKSKTTYTKGLNQSGSQFKVATPANVSKQPTKSTANTTTNPTNITSPQPETRVKTLSTSNSNPNLKINQLKSPNSKTPISTPNSTTTNLKKTSNTQRESKEFKQNSKTGVCKTIKGSKPSTQKSKQGNTEEVSKQSQLKPSRTVPQEKLQVIKEEAIIAQPPAPTNPSKKVIFNQATSIKNIDVDCLQPTQSENNAKMATVASQIDILGLVSKQSLEPTFTLGLRNELSVQPEVASFLEQSYVKIALQEAKSETPGLQQVTEEEGQKDESDIKQPQTSVITSVI